MTATSTRPSGPSSRHRYARSIGRQIQEHPRRSCTDRATAAGDDDQSVDLAFAISHAAMAVFPNAVGAQTIPSSWAVIFATASFGTAEADLELRFNRRARVPLVPNVGPDLVPSRRASVSRDIHEARRCVGEFLAACDHSRLVVRREPHRLRLVELGFEMRQPDSRFSMAGGDPSFHVNQIRANDLNGLGQRPSIGRSLRLREVARSRVLCSLIVHDAHPDSDQVPLR